MTAFRENVIGDLLRAFKQLRPRDDASRVAIAACLGLEWYPGDVGQDDDDETPVKEQLGRVRRAPPPPPKRARLSMDKPEFPEQGVSPPVLTDLPPLEQSERPIPAWLNVEALPHSGKERRPDPPPPDPLLYPLQTRAILTDVLASVVADGPIDVRALGNAICRVEPIIELPRLKRRSLGLGIEVLVDRSQGLTPFYADQENLIDRVRALIGTANTRVLYFDVDPLQGAGEGGRMDWEPWTPPVPTRPVLVLTDLGILKVARRGRRRSGRRGKGQPGAEIPPDWASFAALAQATACPVLALVPYPRFRWPDGMAELFPVLPWDRRLTLKDLRQALGRRWAVTG